MSLRHACIGAAASAMALIAFSHSVPAAPLPAPGILAMPGSIVQKSAYRRCWVRKGRRVCRWFQGSYGFGAYGAFAYYGGYDAAAAARAAASAVPLP
jgi:hypothetical protein